jgi:hypothetical protein
MMRAEEVVYIKVFFRSQNLLNIKDPEIRITSTVTFGFVVLRHAQPEIGLVAGIVKSALPTMRATAAFRPADFGEWLWR